MDNEKIEKAIKEVGREIGLRKNVYPKWIQSGRLTQEKADEQIENMSNAYEILKSYKQANAQYNEVIKQNQSLQAELKQMQKVIFDINYTLAVPATSIKTARDIRAIMRKYKGE